MQNIDTMFEDCLKQSIAREVKRYIKDATTVYTLHGAYFDLTRYKDIQHSWHQRIDEEKPELIKQACFWCSHIEFSNFNINHDACTEQATIFANRLSAASLPETPPAWLTKN